MDRPNDSGTNPANRIGTSGAGTVRIRYFAGAAAAAGTEQEDIRLTPKATVADLVQVLTERHGPQLGRVLVSCSFLVDETAAGAHRPVPGGAEVDVLPPFAGG
ncbi:MAG: MoaD/ThiS family protein [Kineosporiaceae bacterium]